MGEFIVNPALDPTRPWVRTPAMPTSSDPVVVEAGILLRGLRAPGAAAIRHLARSGVPMTVEDLAAQLGDTDERAVDQALHQANQFAEAFGFLPLVQRDERGYRLAPDVIAVVEATSGA